MLPVYRVTQLEGQAEIYVAKVMSDADSAASADQIISSLVEHAHADPTWLQSIAAIRQNQHAHERAWHDARTLIVKKYETKRTLNTLLTGAGGAEGVTTEQLKEQEEAELRAYDEKLRMTMLRMYVAQQDELKKLGIKVLRDEEAMRRVYRVLEELLVADT